MESSASSDNSDSEDVVCMPQFELPSVETFKPAIRNKALPLKVPSPFYREKEYQPKKSNRVLTSKENMEAIEEKQKMKEEEARKKAERKLARKKEKEERVKQKRCTGGNFTAKELELFQRRYDNGYDLINDDRYNQWLKVRDACIQ